MIEVTASVYDVYMVPPETSTSRVTLDEGSARSLMAAVQDGFPGRHGRGGTGESTQPSQMCSHPYVFTDDESASEDEGAQPACQKWGLKSSKI